MTAGKGIIHSEMPQQEDGLLWGFQLWVNLPATQKLTEPSYQEIAPEDIPVVDLENGVRIRVIAGSANSVDGAVRGIATAPLYLDVNTPANTNFEQPVPQGHNAFIYVYEGEAALRGGDGDSQSVDRGHLVVLGDGDAVALETGGQPARFLLVAARPINEPIARYGPFVMTTKEEIHQAIHDFQAGQF